MENVFLYKFFDRETFHKVISNQSLKFTNPLNFNDPFDCVIDRLKVDINDIGDAVKDDMNELKSIFGNDLQDIPESKIADFYLKNVQHKINKTAITCFSLNCGNPLMWSHYAGNHCGVCLVFELTWKTSPFPDIPHEKLNISAVNYDENPQTNYLRDKFKATRDLLFSKSKHWEYENEFRITTLIEEGFYTFKKDFLRGAVFGLRFPDEEIPSAIQEFENNGFENLKFGKAERHGLNFIITDL